MAVGRPEYLQATVTRPTLSQQLFAGVEPKVAMPLSGWLPAVAAGPDALHQQSVSRIFPAETPQQQRAALLGMGRLEGALQNDQAMPTETHPYWR